jgi:hypothetical protein
MAVLSWSDLSGTAPGKKNTGGWTLRSSPWPVLWYIINHLQCWTMLDLPICSKNGPWWSMLGCRMEKDRKGHRRSISLADSGLSVSGNGHPDNQMGRCRCWWLLMILRSHEGKTKKLSAGTPEWVVSCCITCFIQKNYLPKPHSAALSAVCFFEALNPFLHGLHLSCSWI